MSLSPLPPMRRRDLVVFDLSRGMPRALAVLKAELGIGRLLRVLRGLALHSRRDPLRGLSRPWPRDKEWLTRRQLRPVVLLDDVLRDDLRMEHAARVALLGRVVGEAGARFLAANVPAGIERAWRRASPAERERFATSLVGRFFNVAAAPPRVDAASLAFDVQRCRFAELTAELGRPYLGPLFCAADSVYFERPDVPVSLERSGTLAEGAGCCDFRLRYREGESD